MLRNCLLKAAPMAATGMLMAQQFQLASSMDRYTTFWYRVMLVCTAMSEHSARQAQAKLGVVCAPGF